MELKLAREQMDKLMKLKQGSELKMDENTLKAI